MTDRDALMERLERVNPVPDVDRLLARPDPSADFSGLEQRRRQMTETQIRQLEPPGRRSARRRGTMVAAIAATVVLVVGIATVLVSSGDARLVAVGADGIVVTFDGETCTTRGATDVAVGDFELTLVNESDGTIFADFVRLDEGRTAADFTESDLTSGRPAWVSGVWSELTLGAGMSTGPQRMTLAAGTHVLVCGSFSPYLGVVGPTINAG